MKKINDKGFTLIELLAVIVIMGILMMVAIPAVSRTIENSRKDTFLDVAKQYANSAKTLWAADGIECSNDSTNYTVSSALPAGSYYISIDSSNTNPSVVLLDQGGKSPWGNSNVKGFVRIVVTAATGGRVTSDYYVALSDNTHGIKSTTATDGLKADSMKRTSVGNATFTDVAMPTAPNTYTCREV